MAETLVEFFSEDDITGSDIHEEAALIHEYLSGKLTVDAAASKLLLIFKNKAGSVKIGQYDVSELIETIIVSVAEQLPETHEQLVTLLGALKEQKETSNFELPLASSLNERWLRYGDPDQSSSLRDEVRNEWTNLNRFAALVYEAEIQDLSAFGIKTLGMTLKREGWRVNWEGSNTSDSIVALEGHAPAAVQWITVSGLRLYTQSIDAPANWVVWEANLEWIAGLDQLNGEIKSSCQEALTEMRRIAAL